MLITVNLHNGELPEMVDAQNGDLIIEQMSDNMNARGWTEVPTTANPDVVILPAVNRTTNVDAYYFMAEIGVGTTPAMSTIMADTTTRTPRAIRPERCSCK